MTLNPAEVQQAVDDIAALHAEIADLCAYRSLGIVFGALLNILGECLVSMHSDEAAYAAALVQLQKIPTKVEQFIVDGSVNSGQTH